MEIGYIGKTIEREIDKNTGIWEHLKHRLPLAMIPAGITWITSEIIGQHGWLDPILLSIPLWPMIPLMAYNAPILGWNDYTPRELSLRRPKYY